MGAFPLPRLRGAAAFSMTELRVQLHEGIAIFTSIMTQAVLLVFVRILAPQLFEVAVLGSLIFSVFTLGQRVLNEAAYIRVDHRLNQLYLASPLTPDSYFVGISVGVLLAYLLPILLLVGVAVATIPFTPGLVVLLLSTAAAVWVFTSSLGYILSTTFRDMRAIWSQASILYNLFGVLPPVFYPLSLFPTALRPIALVMPPSAATALLQASIGVVTLSPSETLLAAGSLVAEAAALFVFALYWARRTAMER
jgi:ABC-2 type transport system permease protein